VLGFDCDGAPNVFRQLTRMAPKLRHVFAMVTPRHERLTATRNSQERVGRMPEIMEGVEFKDGISNFKTPPDHAITNF